MDPAVIEPLQKLLGEIVVILGSSKALKIGFEFLEALFSPKLFLINISKLIVLQTGVVTFQGLLFYWRKITSNLLNFSNEIRDCRRKWKLVEKYEDWLEIALKIDQLTGWLKIEDYN